MMSVAAGKRSVPAAGAKPRPGAAPGGAAKGAGAKRASPWIAAIRAVAMAVFVASIPVILFVPVGRRLFWTVAIAAIPLVITTAGFYFWRRICPLALFGQAGRFLRKPGTRKAGEWLGRNYLYVQLGLMLVALALRLVATNGTPWALAGFVGVVVAGAVAVSFVYTGKTWCNTFCPVGLVEKLYNEPAHLARQDNSQCASCTACKKNCPDIDVEQGYWKEADSPARRIAYFAWPGIVFAFYFYYWLVAGDWDYYFSGVWTRESAQAQGLFGPGFFFAPAIPRVVAAPLTLVSFAAASVGLFAVGEHAARLVWGGTPEKDARLRHRALILAGFSGFVLFYCFAGQPTLRKLPEVARQGIAIAVVFVATAMLIRRWMRSENSFVQEKFARGILRRWEWGDAPPSDNLADIYLIHTERTKQREARLKAYKETVRDMIADGIVSRNELAMLDKLRGQLGIDDKDHDKVLSELSAEEKRLFDPAYHGSVELRLQRQQYQRDLERLFMLAAKQGAAPAREALEALRAEHRVPEADHAEALAALSGENGPLRAQAQSELAHAARLRRAARRARGAERPKYAAGSAADHSLSVAFFGHLCDWRAGEHVERATTILAAIGVAAPSLDDPPDDPAADAAAMIEAARDASPYVRAGAVYVLSRFDDADSRKAAAAGISDEHALVRETAVRALGARGRLTRELVTRAMEDPDQRVVRAVMRAVVPAAAAGAATVDPKMLAQTTQGVGTPDPAQFATLDPRAALDTLSTFEKMMLLRQVPLFGALDPDDLEELSRIAVERRYASGTHLCREGEASDEVFLVVSGLVRAWVGDEASPRVLGESGDGSCIGEMAALDRAPRTATVTAVREARVLVLAGRDFKELLRDRPAIAQGVIGVLTRRLRDMIAARSAS
jgi:hypothetical protein